MNGINVISINPSESTAASMHPEVFEKIVRECKVNSYRESHPHLYRRIINVLSGIDGRVTSGCSGRLAWIRIIAGAGLIILGCNPLQCGLSSFSSIASIILGSSLIIGSFTRITSFAAAIYFISMTIADLFGGTLNASLMLPALIASIFTIMGPGIYSCDRFIRRSLIKYSQKLATNKKHKTADNRLSYKAFAINS